MVNAQQWLDANYPKENRSEIKELHINGFDGEYHKYEEEKLSGSLDLSDFVNLEKLDCSGNLLTNLDLTKCINMQELDCGTNELTELNLTNCVKLKELKCY